MNHEPTLDLFEEMFREATEAHIATEDNRDLIRDTYNDLVDEAIASGQIVVTGAEVTRMARDSNWARLNSKAARATQTLLKSLVRGEVPLFDVDAVLDQVITSGEKRRTTIRHLMRTDVVRMTATREDNYAKQRIARDEWVNEIAPTLTGWLSEFGSIPGALSAGAIHLTKDITEEESA